jgi:hypothetical protein
LIIGICGFIGSGKGTVGDYLKNDRGFIPVSFAATLKDATAAIFGWERRLLEGDTEESRTFREERDDWWSVRLGYDVTPRLILQRMGTEVMRNNLHENIWLYSLEKSMSPYNNYVITDVRFPNEIDFVGDLGGYVIRVKRGNDPPWYDELRKTVRSYADEYMKSYWPHVHASEYSWASAQVYDTITNDGTLVDLYNQVDSLLSRLSHIEYKKRPMGEAYNEDK